MDKIDKHVLLRFLHEVLDFAVIAILHGFIHADLHMGNYGIRNPETPESMRIVLYDFGHMYDVRKLSSEVRTNIVLYNQRYDSIGVGRFILDDKYHIDKFINIMSEHIELGNKIKHQYITKQLISYLAINGIKLNKQKFQMLAFMEKTVSAANIVNNLEKHLQYRYMYNDLRKSTYTYYLDKYFPYDDMKIIHDKFGHLVMNNSE